MSQPCVYSLSELLLNDSINGTDNHYTKNAYTTKNNNTYSILHYDKNFLSVDLISTVGLLRSVIMNKDNYVVCFAPPKSYEYNSFITKYPEITPEIVAEEFVEGTMVNVFWDKTSGLSGSWEIATRSTVGGDVCFYKSKPNAKTFRTMFLEAAERNHLNLQMLHPAYCYSFVLQHPENRIVVPFTTPQLYLVEVYEIVHTEDSKIHVFPVYTNPCNCWHSTTIKFPETYTITSYQDLKDRFGSMNTPYQIVGIIIKNKATGERCKLRNPVYEYVRHLKGNQSKVQYQYLVLRKDGRVREFLTFYPEHKRECSYFRDQLHSFTFTLHENYVRCYIKKEKPLKDFPDYFTTHMFTLHKLYINILKPKNEYISNTEVIHYVNTLHPSLLMNSLNTCIRKRCIDLSKADVGSKYSNEITK